ncbi:MAG: GNAT family N-acetyltransferase [Ktedonobacteraceae bacterium]
MTSQPEQHVQDMGLLCLLDLDRLWPASPAPRVPVTFQRADEALAGELATAMGLAGPAPVLQRLRLGRHCYIARVEDQLVAYGWLTFDKEEIGELGLSVRLLPGEAYIWDCATLPAFRGKRLYPALLSHILGELQRTGFQRVWIGMDTDNQSSRTGAVLAGFQPVIDILLVRELHTRRFLVRGYPGVSSEYVQAAQYALLGDRNINSVPVTKDGL